MSGWIYFRMQASHNSQKIFLYQNMPLDRQHYRGLCQKYLNFGNLYLGTVPTVIRCPKITIIKQSYHLFDDAYCQLIFNLF